MIIQRTEKPVLSGKNWNDSIRYINDNKAYTVREIALLIFNGGAITLSQIAQLKTEVRGDYDIME